MSLISESNSSLAEKMANNLLRCGMTYESGYEPIPLVKELAEKIRRLKLEPQTTEISFTRGWSDRVVVSFAADGKLLAYKRTGRIDKWGYQMGCCTVLGFPEEPIAKYELKGEASWLGEAFKELKGRWADYWRTSIPKPVVRLRIPTDQF